MNNHARALSQELVRVAKFLDAIAESGLLADTAPQQPPAPPPPAAVPTAKPSRSPGKRSSKRPPNLQSPKAAAAREYFTTHPQANATQAADAVGCSRSLAAEVLRIVKAERQTASPLAQEEEGGDDSDDEEGPCCDVAEKPPQQQRHEFDLLQHQALLEQLQAMDTAAMRIPEIAERVGRGVALVKKICRSAGIRYKGQREHKPIENPLFSLPADEVERLHPELHAEFQRMIYEERAPLVRAKWKKNREYKRNNYPVDPMVLDRLPTTEIFPTLCIRDRFE